MPAADPRAFDIFETSAGYVPISSEVRLAILEALEEGDLELPDLAEVTGKSKSTLSSVHLKFLIANGLVEDRPHPTDGRRKLFHLKARKIGSSTVPVDRLKSAIKRYVTDRPLGPAVPLRTTLEALGAAHDAPVDVLRVQAKRLGERLGDRLEVEGLRASALALADLVQDEGLARALKLGLEEPDLTLGAPDPVPGDAPARSWMFILAGLAEGMLTGNGLEAEATVLDIDGRPAVRVSLRRTVAADADQPPTS